MRDAIQNPATLELQGIELSYQLPDGGPVHVLSGVDLAVGTGEMVCVAGRSGSGKSSLLYVAAGLLKADAGSVCWLGEPISGLKPAEVTARRRTTIGFVFQSGGLVDLLTAAENVSLPGLARKGSASARADTRARTSLLLDDVELGDRSDHFPSELSGGERQRVALARALFSDPPLLIVDEPTASLDAVAAKHIIDLLKSLSSDGHSILVASHDQHVIDGADRILRLE